MYFFCIYIVGKSKVMLIYEIGTWDASLSLICYLRELIANTEAKINFKKFCNSKHFAFKSDSCYFISPKNMFVFGVFFRIFNMCPLLPCAKQCLCLILPQFYTCWNIMPYYIFLIQTELIFFGDFSGFI